MAINRMADPGAPKRIQRKCAKCRDTKKWSPAEVFKGIAWHWFLSGGFRTALAKRCMKAVNHG